MMLEKLGKLDPGNPDMAYGGFDVLRHVFRLENPEDLDIPALQREVAQLLGFKGGLEALRVIFLPDIDSAEGFAGPGEYLVFGLSGLYERYVLGHDADWAEVYVVPAQKGLEFLAGS